ncbi:hypothetical protein DTO271D3_1128 [Paecilomyces variotii]|nr:hypothetical protein DTO271D3_1128 [Paecilomyces variotii]
MGRDEYKQTLEWIDFSERNAAKSRVRAHVVSERRRRLSWEEERMMRALRERSRTGKPPVHGDLPHSKPAALQPLPAQLSMSHQEWLSSGFLGVLIKYDVTGQGLEAYATYLPDIVHLVGTNSALDDAVAVFSTCYAGRADSIETIRAYGRALRSLRECISIPQLASSTDTLCAAMLLGLYGSLFPRSRLGVLSHHEGVSKIIQYRGPGRHRTGFEQQLVISHWAANIMSSLFRGQGCYLESEEWREILCPTSIRHINEFDLFLCQIFEAMTTLPGTLRDFRTLKNACGHFKLPGHLRSRLDSYFVLLNRIGCVVEDLLSQGTTAITVPSVRFPNIVDESFSFRDRPTAMLYVLHWTFSLVVQDLISTCSPYPTASQTSAQIYVRRIYMSYDYARSFPPYFSSYMLLPLVAAVASDENDSKAWILTAINDLYSENIQASSDDFPLNAHLLDSLISCLRV